MKKVNLIGKKIMSAGLAASLLVTSLGNTSCFAGDPPTNQAAGAPQSEKSSTTVKISVTNNQGQTQPETQPETQETKTNPDNKKEGKLKKVFNVIKSGVPYVAVWAGLAVIAYIEYKTGKAITNLSKEYWNVILENKERFVNSDFAKFFTDSYKLATDIILFLWEHLDAVKNIMSIVGTYSVLTSIKNKLSKENSNKEKPSTGNKTQFEGSFTTK